MNINELSNSIDNEMLFKNRHFPIDIFPRQIQELIINANETVGFNMEFFSAGILSACATSIGKSVTIYNGSYISYAILWVAIIGGRGTAKTHPLEFACKPIDQKDKIAYKEYENQFSEFDSDGKTIKKPRYAKYILKDFTPEKLADCLQNNPKGVLLHQDELMKWILSFDKYKKGGDQQMYLELFNGNALTVDRVSKEPIRIDQTNVNILGGMQPPLLKKMANNNRSEDGFLDRFLFVFPKNLQPILFTGLDIDKRHSDNYDRLINNLLNISAQKIIASKSNIEIYKKWQHKKVRESFIDMVERSIQAKLETYVWRLALIIEMMDQASHNSFNENLKDENMKKAIKLIEYFRENALSIHSKILDGNPLNDLTESAKVLYKMLPVEFKRKDVLPIFESNGFRGGTIGRFLSEETLFTRIRIGHYRKKWETW